MKFKITRFKLALILFPLFTLKFLIGCKPIFHSGNTYYKDYSKLENETKHIMNHLGIRIRDSIDMDGKMVFHVIDTLLQPTLKDFDGQFARSKSGRTLDNNGDAVKYSAPIIYLSKMVDSILSEKRNESHFMEIYARSILVHELTHYLQKTVVITYSNRAESAEKYLSYQDENEAFTVQAYYLLKYYAPERLQEQSSFQSSIKYREFLLNNMLRIFDSHRDKNNNITDNL
jgi:hypothetical protein